LPESEPFSNTSVEHFKNLARIAERGKLDSLFLADSPVPGQHLAGVQPAPWSPTVLLAALAGATEHVGLIATASTTYNEPYNLARRFASLDHLSGGRAGWEYRHHRRGGPPARNFNLEEYRRTPNAMSVLQSSWMSSLKLWDSWADDAPLGDKERGVWGR